MNIDDFIEFQDDDGDKIFIDVNEIASARYNDGNSSFITTKGGLDLYVPANINDLMNRLRKHKQTNSISRVTYKF